MKISKAVLDEHEVEILRELAQTNCNGISCDFCPLNFTLGTGLKVCTVDVAVLCLKQNDINPYERLKGEKSDNEQNY